jgi:IS5 family transposase
MCRNLAKQHVDDMHVTAAPDGAPGYSEWVRIALILPCVVMDKSLRESEDYLKEMTNIPGVFELDESPHHSSHCTPLLDL